MFRPAKLADLKVVASWITSARDCALWAGWRVRFPIGLELLPTAIEFSEMNAVSLFDGESLVAFGQLVAQEERRGHLARIIVSPSARGKGFGKVLVKALLEKARADSYEQISLNVDQSNLPAIALYSKLGFHEAVPPADQTGSSGSRYMVRAP